MTFPAPARKAHERAFYVRANPDFVTSSDVFATARSSFAWLVTGPEPVSVDGREIPGLPQRAVPLDELGSLLLARGCPQPTRDAAWTYLITRARAEGGTWTVACVGLGLPVLLRVAARVTRRFTGDTHDLNAAVMTGFLQGLREVDLARPAILARLYWAAYREGRRALHDAVSGPRPTDGLGFDTASAPSPQGHPDLVLAAAVEAGVITTGEAALISETRVGAQPLAEAAHARGLPYKTAQKMRFRAERRLVRYLDSLRDTAPGTPADTAPGDGVARRSQRRCTPAPRADATGRARRETSRNVTGPRAGEAEELGTPVSPHHPKSRIAPRGTPPPADRRHGARRTTAAPAAPTRRENRSCD